MRTRTRNVACSKRAHGVPTNALQRFERGVPNDGSPVCSGCSTDVMGRGTVGAVGASTVSAAAADEGRDDADERAGLTAPPCCWGRDGRGRAGSADALISCAAERACVGEGAFKQQVCRACGLGSVSPMCTEHFGELGHRAVKVPRSAVPCAGPERRVASQRPALVGKAVSNVSSNPRQTT